MNHITARRGRPEYGSVVRSQLVNAHMARILVVDDEPQIRRMICRMLTAIGHTTIEASNGGECLTALAVQGSDLVLTDILMPDIEGIELITEIRKLYPGMPIVAMSGGSRISDLDYLDFARKLGAVFALQKPFVRSDLLRVIDDSLITAEPT